MKRSHLTAFISWALVSAAMAQPAPPKTDSARETVIVTAPKLHSGVTPNAIAHDFIKSFAAPTVLRDAIARWQVPICPDFEGLAPQFVQVMEERFRSIATRAGVSVKEKGCRPNLVVAFTPQPQAYLDALHRKNLDALGYHGLTTMTHPIQAWYVTGSRDNRGQVYLDKDGALVLDFPMMNGGPPPIAYIANTNTVPATNVGGWRDHPDLSSDLLYVTIIVDSAKTARYQVGEIADYVAMLALARTDDYEDCQLVPSIANLLTSRCDDRLKPSQVTPTDIAYLRGVYKMDPGATLQIQQDQIAGEMARSMEPQSK